MAERCRLMERSQLASRHRRRYHLRVRRRGSLPSLSRSHPCAAMFIDETGAISRDRFFGVGTYKAVEPSRLLRSVQKLRDQEHWYKEIKFSDATKGSLPFYRKVIDIALADGAGDFFCFIADRHEADPIERFGTTWDAYGKLAEQLVVACLRPDELVSVMADNYSSPDEVLFEEDLRASVNRRLRRLAVVSVCRLDSKSSDGLQVVDLLTSAAAFEFRASAGLASASSPRGQLAEYVRERLGAESLLNGWRSARHSVAVYSHGAWTPEGKRT